MTCSTETKTTSHDIGCDSAADLDWCCLKMLLLLALQSLLVCSLHSGQAVANPVASLVETTCANSCSCSDMEDFTQKSARKVEAHFGMYITAYSTACMHVIFSNAYRGFA